MFFTLFTVALFVAASIRGVAASFAVNSPALIQCQSAKISWAPTQGPYNLIVAPGDNMCGDPLVDLGDFETTITYWTVTLPAGTQGYLSVLDANGDEAWSNLLTVTDGGKSSCLSSSASSPSSSSPSPSPSLAPLGAANAGSNNILNSGAIMARHASLPILILAGLAVVATLL